MTATSANSAAHMLALRAHRYGEEPVVSLDEVAVPSIGTNDVLVHNRASTISFVDLLLARGGYQLRPSLPLTLGTEFAGMVVAKGDRVDERIQVGQAVAGTVFGGAWAQYVCAPSHQVTPIAQRPDWHTAASLGITAATAVFALQQRARLRSEETVLVLGATGGVGLAAVQVARHMKARVIAGTRDQNLWGRLQEAGAHEVVSTEQPDWRDALRRMAPQGLDVVLDPLGDRWTEPAFRSLSWGGRHLVVGFAGGQIPQIKTNLALLKGAALMGVDLRQFGEKQPQANLTNLEATAQLFQQGVLDTPIAAQYNIADWQQALRHANQRPAWGKIALNW